MTSTHPRLLTTYQETIIPLLMQEFGITNRLAAPKLIKIVISSGITDEQHRDEALENMVKQLSMVTGQKPVIARAKKSIAAFKLRAGDSVGVKVTLRAKRMYQFLDKLVSLVLPRVKDFQGVPKDAFDGKGNYSLGLPEQIVFPEVDYDTIDKVRGLEITLVTDTTSDKKARRLLELFGMPFEKKQEIMSKK